MHLEPGVEAALQKCHVQELLEPSPHLNQQCMSIYVLRGGDGISPAAGQLDRELALDSKLGLHVRDMIDLFWLTSSVTQTIIYTCQQLVKVPEGY